MLIEWNEPHCVVFDLMGAVESFQYELEYQDKLNLDDYDYERAIYNAVNDNIKWEFCGQYEDRPVEIAAKALKKYIGGIQMRMELD